ncbi:hypothetical protein BC940DRAFT_166446 [Gongronella butleri]|nr:hypothetical protein BC940DRAFT_166446 [Gongronella butleri]
MRRSSCDEPVIAELWANNENKDVRGGFGHFFSLFSSLFSSLFHCFLRCAMVADTRFLGAFLGFREDKMKENRKLLPNMSSEEVHVVYEEIWNDWTLMCSQQQKVYYDKRLGSGELDDDNDDDDDDNASIFSDATSISSTTAVHEAVGLFSRELTWSDVLGVLHCHLAHHVPDESNLDSLTLARLRNETMALFQNPCASDRPNVPMPRKTVEPLALSKPNKPFKIDDDKIMSQRRVLRVVNVTPELRPVDDVDASSFSLDENDSSLSLDPLEATREPGALNRDSFVPKINSFDFTPCPSELGDALTSANSSFGTIASPGARVCGKKEDVGASFYDNGVKHLDNASCDPGNAAYPVSSDLSPEADSFLRWVGRQKKHGCFKKRDSMVQSINTPLRQVSTTCRRPTAIPSVNFRPFKSLRTFVRKIEGVCRHFRR